MKKLLQIMRLPSETEERYIWAHQLWIFLGLAILGCGAGIVSLLATAYSVEALDGAAVFASYWRDPGVLLLNLWMPVLLAWLFYFLFRRAWVGFLGSALPVLILALVNYFKIRLRGDPLWAKDLSLVSEAAGIVGNYQLDLTWVVWTALLFLIVGLLLTIFLMPRGLRGWRERLFGGLSVLGLLGVSFFALYMNPYHYETLGEGAGLDRWNETEHYVSRGTLASFLHSFRELVYTGPEDYDDLSAAELLARYEDADIPEERKVSVMGIMLEAFCDLTDFETLSQVEAVQQVYRPWHALEDKSVSGRLLTNIFAGGTVDTEWAFLTGYSSHGDFVKNTDSYVWYLDEQGYQTFGSHPGFGWFYDREHVNPYLGFQDYWFTENHYGSLVDPVAAQWKSDHVLMEELLKQLNERVKDGPCFSFSVSYQNHGPYEWEYTAGKQYLTPQDTGLDRETCNIWNNYLMRVEDTLDALADLLRGIEKMEEPVVVTLFGDHKPWGGNGNTAYTSLGADFDLSTVEGFYDYYSTPYVIWANSAAKKTLGNDFTQDGGDFSPCFLMQELFDQCGWEGPGFMQLARQVREVTPLVHEQGIYWVDGMPSGQVSEENQPFLRAYQSAEYYREQEIVPGGPQQVMEETEE